MTPTELLATTALASWKQVTTRLDQGVRKATDEHLQKEIAPGKNRIYYLIGHLTAVNDRMLPMLGLGDRLYPQLDEPFVTQPDRAVPDPLSIPELRQAWNEVNTKLTEAFEKLTPEDWLKPHAAVSEEDFAKEPLRNRLAVLLSRTNHVSFHVGQIVLVK